MYGLIGADYDPAYSATGVVYSATCAVCWRGHVQDMFLVVISFLVFIAVAVLFMSSFSYKTRTTLALAGVFVVALGIVAGWGWGMIFGARMHSFT
jgi:hypothetical protein